MKEGIKNYGRTILNCETRHDVEAEGGGRDGERGGDGRRGGKSGEKNAIEVVGKQTRRNGWYVSPTESEGCPTILEIDTCNGSNVV